MLFRVVTLYLIILLFNSVYCGPFHSNIKRRHSADEEDKSMDLANETKDVEKSKTNEAKSNEKHENQGDTKTQGEIDEQGNDNDTENNNDKSAVSSETEKIDVNGNKQPESDGDKQTKSEEKEEENNIDEHNSHEVDQARPFKVGDTFTPQELLPVAIKLRAKVNKPGGGKGFVSSSKSPEQLADKLFEAFFMTFKRIVTLREPDITGLDALQALALSGEAIQNISETVTAPSQTKYLRGQFVKMKNKPKTSKFNLIMKRTASKSKFKNEKRRGIELAKKLRKKRRLVVNKRRRAPGDKLMMVRKRRRLVVNKRRQAQQENTTTKNKESACHWGYECSDPTDLDTCQLFTKCKDQKEAKEENIIIPHNSDEHSKAIQQFRKMLGISLVDEEVEKILESRIISMKPNRLNADERVESLSEYFNSILMAEELRTTTALSPYANDEDTTEINSDDAKAEQNQKMIETDFKNESKEKHEMRKSLKFMIKTTPFPS